MTATEDPLLAPFTDLEQRKIPNQGKNKFKPNNGHFHFTDEDKYKSLILAVYMIFLIAGVPIWLYCTYESNEAIPSKFLEIIKQREVEELADPPTDKMQQNFPNFRKSEVKLKFIFMTPEAHKLCKWKSDKFDKFLNSLKPEMAFKRTFSTKYSDQMVDNENGLIEGLIKSLRFRDEVGREDIFNFIVVEAGRGSLELEEKMVFIPDWGVVNIIKTVETSPCVYSIDKFLVGFSKLIGFEEINSWKAGLRQFYLKRSFDMMSQLKGARDGTRIPSGVYKTKLNPAMEELRSGGSIKEAFDLVDSAFHDPELMAAAYFPDDHKFAVYLPVFLPLILPILIAFIKEVKERRVKRDGKKVKNE